MKEAHGIVMRGLVRRITEKKRKRSDILVSYYDSPGKSGAEYAKLYADENEIYYENVIERGEIGDALRSKQDLQVLVFIDDIIGTGDSAREYFGKLVNAYRNIMINADLKMFFIAVCGFQLAQAETEKILAELDLPMKVHMCDPLDESAICFGQKSQIFPDPDDRRKAKDLCYQHGERLVKKAPLGYKDSQATIVFPDTCPDNTLPILWAETRNWTPLFPRQ